MVPSPPSKLSSVTIAATVPPCASTTTPYCVSSERPGTFRGSTRSAPPRPNSPTDCSAISAPSEKRYHRSVALVAPVDCTTIGVLQPRAPPSVRVTLGRYARFPWPLEPTYPIAAPPARVASSTASAPPLTPTEYSPPVTIG